jgi:hypothetical protein
VRERDGVRLDDDLLGVRRVGSAVLRRRDLPDDVQRPGALHVRRDGGVTRGEDTARPAARGHCQRQPACIEHSDMSSMLHVLMVPVQEFTPDTQSQPTLALHVAWVVWLAQSCGVPLQVDVVQEQSSTASQAVSVVFALHGVRVPPQVPVLPDQSQ